MHTLQTTEPLRQWKVSPLASGAYGFYLQRDYYDLNPPYQRAGQLWSSTKRIALIKSFLLGMPIPTLIVNDRLSAKWATNLDTNFLAVVDGKQRIETIQAWFGGDLAVPASWFDPDVVEGTENCGDGPYVSFTGLAKSEQSHIKLSWTIPTVEARLPSVEAEAELFLLVNGQGIPQTEDDLTRAQAVADGSRV